MTVAPSQRALKEAERIVERIDAVMAHDAINDAVRQIALALDAARADERGRCARACERLVNRETWPEGYQPARDPDPNTCMVCAAWILKLKDDP